VIEKVRQNSLVVLIHRYVHILDEMEQVACPAGNESRIQEDLAALSPPLHCQSAHEPLPPVPPAAHPRAARLPRAAGPGRAPAVRGEQVARTDVREGGHAAPALRAHHHRAREGPGDQVLEGRHQAPRDGCRAGVQQHVPRVRHDDHRGRRYPVEHSLQGVPLVPPAQVLLASTKNVERHPVFLQL